MRVNRCEPTSDFSGLPRHTGDSQTLRIFPKPSRYMERLLLGC